jgi:hypothetical protein
MRWLATILSLLFLGFCSTSCTERRAQVAVQTALDTAMGSVVAGDEVLAEALPGAGAAARARAEERCQTTCPDLAALVLEEMQPWVRAVTGFSHARATLYVAQDGLDLWIDVGTLPDYAPLCGEIEETFGSLVGLLETVGVDVPSAIDQVAPHISTVCELVAGFVRGAQ